MEHKNVNEEARLNPEKHFGIKKILLEEKLRKQGSNIKEPETAEKISNLGSNVYLNRLTSKKKNLQSVIGDSTLSKNEDCVNTESDKKLSRVAIVNKLADQIRNKEELKTCHSKKENSPSKNHYADTRTTDKQDVHLNNFMHSTNNKGNDSDISSETLLNKSRVQKMLDKNRSAIKTEFKVVKETVAEDIKEEDQTRKHLIDSDENRRNSHVSPEGQISEGSITPVNHTIRSKCVDRLQSKKRNLKLEVGSENRKTDVLSSSEDKHSEFQKFISKQNLRSNIANNLNLNSRSNRHKTASTSYKDDYASGTTSPNSNASTRRPIRRKRRNIRSRKSGRLTTHLSDKSIGCEFLDTVSNNMKKTQDNKENSNTDMNISFSNVDIKDKDYKKLSSSSSQNNNATETSDNKNKTSFKTNVPAVQDQSDYSSSPTNQKDVNVKIDFIKNIGETGIEANLTKHLVLAHGKHTAKPIERLANANFCEDVHRELSLMRLTEIYRIQAYSWPHLLRGNSLIIINPARSGKTLAYLPAFCSIIKMKVDDKTITDGVGPIGIILATSSVEVDKIAQICRRFFNYSTKKLSILKACGVRNTNQISSQLLNGCDILIATVPCLSRLLSDRIKLFDNKRIQHMVIDNMDLMHENLKPDLHKILRKCCSLSKERITTFVQLVITARSWNPCMTGFLKICKNPQLCIGSYLEAAVYARSKISMNLVKNNTKGYEIIKFIQAHPYQKERLVIICNKDEEVKEIVEALKSISAIFLYCTSESTAIEIERTRGWHNQKDSEMSILVCTDSVLPELIIRKAQNMINYSLPSSWSRFSLRFSTFLHYYEDLIQNDTLSKPAASSLILLDENNNSQLPKLIEFLQEHGETKIPHEVLNLSQRIRIQREMNYISEMTELCPYLIDYGNCVERSDCKKRHILTKSDTPDEHFPKEGLIKIKILNVISPIHYCVRLCENKSTENDSTWIKVNKSENYLHFNIQFSQYFADSSNHQIQWPIKAGDLCVVIDSNVYHRCLVVDAKVPTKGITSLDINLRVKLVDNGLIIPCRSSNILELPDQFKNFPFQAVDLHLVGVVPQDFEQEWDANVTKTVKHWFDQYVNKKNYVEASIKLSLCNSIWAENIRIVEKLEEISSSVNVIDIKKSLLAGKYAVSNSKGIDNLQQIAFECGIINKPDPPNNSASNSANISDELSKGESIIFSENYNDNECNSLDQPSMTNHLVKTSELFPKNNNSSSDTKLNINDDVQERTRQNVIKTKDNEKWENLPKNEFCRVSVGAFYTPNLFYVQNVSNIGSLESIYRELDKYTSSNKRKNVIEPKIGMNCIAKIDGQYNRGKITKILCEPSAVMCEVFFVDIGLSDIINIDQILQSTDYFIKVLPFQAIRCRLLGIQPVNNGIWVEEVCDKIYDDIIDRCDFIYARNIKSELPDRAINELKCMRHDVILLDCTTDDDVKLNETIIEKGLANYDPDTKHFLDLLVNLDVCSDDSDYNDWDHCNYKRSQPSLHTSNKPQMDDNNANTDGLEIFDFDVNFTEEETLRLLNVPLTAKILPAVDLVSDESRFTEIYEEKSTKIEKKHQELTTSEKMSNKECFELNPKDYLMLSRSKNGSSSEENMPSLKAIDKIPQVVWQQSESIISLNIYAPDINDYYLKVTSTYLKFSASVQDQMNVLIINFFGGVNPEFTSHEIRGLNVVVRLVKSIKTLPWPRLCFETDKHAWLKCNFDASRFANEQTNNTCRVLQRSSSNYRPDDSDTDDGSVDMDYDRNKDDFKNCDTMYDPLADDF